MDSDLIRLGGAKHRVFFTTFPGNSNIQREVESLWIRSFYPQNTPEGKAEKRQLPLVFSQGVRSKAVRRFSHKPCVHGLVSELGEKPGLLPTEPACPLPGVPHSPFYPAVFSLKQGHQ